MKFDLSNEQEVRFEQLVTEKEDLISMAISAVHIPKPLQDEFYNFALEGLLVSFLVLENGGIDITEFDRFALATMKRKVIDEIRRRSRYRTVTFENVENSKLFIEPDTSILRIEFFSSFYNLLTDKEKLFFEDFLRTASVEITSRNLNISRASGYRLFNSIKKKGIAFFLS